MQMLKRGVVAVAAVSLAWTGVVSGGVEGFRGSVNIDFNAATGSGAGQPAVTFGGAAGQGGFWNPIGSMTPGTTYPVRDLANSIDALSLSVGGTGTVSIFGFDNANTSGDFGLLLDDGLDLGGVGNERLFTLLTLGTGVYRVFVYAGAPDSSTARTAVSVRTAEVDFVDDRSVGGVFPVNGFAAGVTHEEFSVTVTNPTYLQLRVRTEAVAGTLSGVQVQRLEPTRLYVNSGRSGGGVNGLTWATSFQSLTQALAVARATPSVTELWVARGTYRPDRFPNSAGDRFAEFVVPGGVSIVGGFAGTESSLSERPDPSVPGNQTVLTGEIGGPGVTDNSIGLVRTAVSAGGGPGVVRLERLRLTGTYFDIDAGDPLVDNSPVLAEVGGLEMRECVVSGTVGFHAPVTVSGALASELTGCVVEQNRSNTTAGLRLSGTTLVDRCIVRGNVMPGANFGSAVSVPTGSVTIRNSLIEGNNIANTTGGAMFAVGVGSFGENATLTMQNCTLAENRKGGGLHVTDAGGSANTVNINNCILWGNRRPSSPALTVEQQNLWVVGSGHTVSVFDSIVEGWSGALAPAANLNNGGDPKFVDADGADNVPGNGDDDFRLAAFSPARDSGWTGGIPGSVLLDLAGNARRVDDLAVANGGFAGSFIDRGCYEMQTASAACPGDVGQTGGVPGSDGVRDNNDFIVYIDWFFVGDSRADVGRTGGSPGPDGQLNNNDFVAFIDLFFAPC